MSDTQTSLRYLVFFMPKSSAARSPGSCVQRQGSKRNQQSEANGNRVGKHLREFEPWEPMGPCGAVVPVLVILEVTRWCWHISDHLPSK